MEQQKAQVICMTPTKNEEWIIERFVKAASLWADVIIIADQMSTDRTVDIALQYPKVRVITNTSKVFNENERQKLLIQEARKISGKRLLFALDADEFLTSNYIYSDEWNEMLYAEKGTVFNLKWPFIKDDFEHYWEAKEPYNKFAFMDDNSPHIGNAMHSIRIPIPAEAKERYLNEIMVMHFQYTDWRRMESKHLWYQCYERVQNPQKSYCEIFRMYHHMYSQHKFYSIPETWMAYYFDKGIELKYTFEQISFWWDTEVDQYFRDYGSDYFEYIDIKDNHNALLTYLRYTQKYYGSRYITKVIRCIDKIIESVLVKRK